MNNMTHWLCVARTGAHKLQLAKFNPDYFCMAHKLRMSFYIFKGLKKKKNARNRDHMPLAKPKIFPIKPFKKFANLCSRYLLPGAAGKKILLRRRTTLKRKITKNFIFHTKKLWVMRCL